MSLVLNIYDFLVQSAAKLRIYIDFYTLFFHITSKGDDIIDVTVLRSCNKVQTNNY